MTKEQFKNELDYQASIAPFRTMLKQRIITPQDYAIIDTILIRKYSPIFVGNMLEN